MEQGSKSKSAIARWIGGFDRMMGAIRRFFADSWAEMKRCTWPSKSEVLESTVLVLVAIAILSSFVWGVDEVAHVVIRFITTGRI